MNVALRRTLTAAFIVSSSVASSNLAGAQQPGDPLYEPQPTTPMYAEPPSDSATTTTADESAPTDLAAPAPAQDEEPSDDRPERVKVHDIGMGYHAYMFRTEETDRYALHGPAVVYNYFVGRRWGFVLRGSAWFPLRGRMTGPSGDFRDSLRDFYSTRHYGFDGILGVGRRLVFNDRLTITASVGMHIQSFSTSGVKVSPVEAITMGVAGTGRLEYNLTGVLHFGAEFIVGFDPLDLIKHSNRVVLGIPLAGVISLGLDI